MFDFVEPTHNCTVKIFTVWIGPREVYDLISMESIPGNNF
jgi:hypothetical protein